MENYIRVYPNAVSDLFCDKLISKFEDNPEQYYYQDRKNENLDWKMSFTQVHLSDHDIWKDDVKYMMDIFRMYLGEYKEDCNIHKMQWPQEYNFETIRMKRYWPDGEDCFESHVDVTDYENARRFLVFFLYLDDNKEGNTTFPQMDYSASCKKGSLLMFPPQWPWLHAGEKPIDKPKYIVGSYLHYV